MKTLLSIAFAALVAVAVSASGAHADNANGSCNRIVANAMGTSQVCWNFGCVPQDLECAEFTQAFVAFFGDQACAEGFATGDLQGVTNAAALMPDGSSDPGGVKHITEVVCNGVAQCGLCPVAGALGNCGGFCP